MIMMNPPIVDELCDLARVTGVDGVYRRAVCHALNLKETARRHAISLGKKYEDCNFIVCHIDGGISITAHKKGKMIDGNDAGGGEGPFTPTRMGTMAVTDITRYFWDKTQAEMKSLCSQTGGLSSYFGTSNSDATIKKVEEGDRKATRVWNAHDLSGNQIYWFYEYRITGKSRWNRTDWRTAALPGGGRKDP